jgi:hypothetical protein
MTESIGDLLSRHRRSEPKEVKQIKDYVLKRFNKPVNVKITAEAIRIETDNSALAGELRLQTYNIQNLLNTDKRLVIRIV